MTTTENLIDSLAAELRPERPRSQRLALGGLAGIAAATLALVSILIGLRYDVEALDPSPLVAISGGLIALVAVSAGLGAVRSARPQVGAPSSGARWTVSALLVLPLAVVAGIAANPALGSGLAASDGAYCLSIGLASGLATLVFLGLWQRSGAPVNIERSAWLSGIAAGAVGALAVTIHCPLDVLAHVGIWHVAAVPLSGIAGRLALPPLIRW